MPERTKPPYSVQFPGIQRNVPNPAFAHAERATPGRPMELYQLRTFAAVAEEGHLTRAAARIHASQSTVSAQIRALEDELGVPLFVRAPRGMRLTPEGEALLQKARETLAGAEGLLEAARALREDLTGTAHVGLNACPELLRGARLATELRADHPRLTLRFTNTMSGKVLEDLAAGNLDAGYVFGDYPEDFEGPVVMRSRMLVAAPAAWKERFLDTPWEDLASMPWVWTSPECPFTRVAEAMFPDRDRRPDLAAVTDSETVVTALVAAGNGLALMREDEALKAEATGGVVLHPRPAGEVPLSFLHHARRSGDRLIAALQRAVRNVWELSAGA